jgi:hypothetical protein
MCPIACSFNVTILPRGADHRTRTFEPAIGNNEGMAHHATPEEMAVAGVGQYLGLAKLGLNTATLDGGVYGYPAVLLLLSVVDALSNFSGYPKHSFKALVDMDPRLTDQQVKKLAKWFRHLLAHHAIIMPGTMLSTEEGEPCEFAAGEPVHIRVHPFYRLVDAAWTNFDKSRIKARFRTEELPKKPVALAAGSIASPISTSGSHVPTAKP